MKGKGNFLTRKIIGTFVDVDDKKVRETEDAIRRTELLIAQRPDIAHILRIELAGYRKLLTKLKQGHSE